MFFILILYIKKSGEKWISHHIQNHKRILKDERLQKHVQIHQIWI